MALGRSVLGPGHKGFQPHGKGVLSDRDSCRPGRAGLGCPRSCRQSRGLGWRWTFTLGRSCYLQEFCLMGATVERPQAEGLRGHRLTSSHPESGRDTYPPGSDWTRGRDSGGPPGGAFLWLEA